MENKLKLSIAITIAAAAAVSLHYLTLQHRRRRRSHENTRNSQKSCYLSSEFKPQSSFKRVLADNSYSPFKHLALSNSPTNEKSSNLHPYEKEIMELLKNPGLNSSFFDEMSMLKMSKSHVWVDSESRLRELVGVLSEEKIFGVDTEQHSRRSFLGFTTLVQISTMKEDYLVDTISLHDLMHLLRRVFSDLNIVKVFHGAGNDVLWLQIYMWLTCLTLLRLVKFCQNHRNP